MFAIPDAWPASCLKFGMACSANVTLVMRFSQIASNDHFQYRHPHDVPPLPRHRRDQARMGGRRAHCRQKSHTAPPAPFHKPKFSRLRISRPSLICCSTRPSVGVAYSKASDPLATHVATNLFFSFIPHLLIRPCSVHAVQIQFIVRRHPYHLHHIFDRTKGKVRPGPSVARNA